MTNTNTAVPLGTESQAVLPINAVERETGVSKELLRMWERRYRFPTPSRDAQGDRIYPMDQVNKLRVLRRLIEFGFRPGKIIEMNMEDLEKLLGSQSRQTQSVPPALEKELLEVLKNRDVHRLRQYLSHQLIKMGLQSFVVDFLQYTNHIVGDAWMRGELEVYEEHLYTEVVHSQIRAAIASLRDASDTPHVMVTTPPDEQHTLGMLMVEAILRLENVDAVNFGGQMPIRDIVQAVQKHHLDVVALSFSASFPTTRAIDFLEELRFRLPPTIAIWAGGSSLRATRRNVQGVEFLQDLSSINDIVASWRRQRSDYS